jgi:hypothetical protein
MDAASQGITVVDGAWIPVVTLESRACHTDAFGTQARLRARIPVVAGAVRRHQDTEGITRGITDRHQTRAAVGAIQGHSRALRRSPHVVDGAGVQVVAGIARKGLDGDVGLAGLGLDVTPCQGIGLGRAGAARVRRMEVADRVAGAADDTGGGEQVPGAEAGLSVTVIDGARESVVAARIEAAVNLRLDSACVARRVGGDVQEDRFPLGQPRLTPGSEEAQHEDQG